MGNLTKLHRKFVEVNTLYFYESGEGVNHEDPCNLENMICNTFYSKDKEDVI